MSRDANAIRYVPPPLFYVIDERGAHIRIAWTDETGAHHMRELSPFHAQCLIEDLARAVRSRIPGGW